jgi:hypothetical protein
MSANRALGAAFGGEGYGMVSGPGQRRTREPPFPGPSNPPHSTGCRFPASAAESGAPMDVMGQIYAAIVPARERQIARTAID